MPLGAAVLLCRSCLSRSFRHTCRGTFPVMDNTSRITLCPGSAVGPNMHGHPPSITVMPC